MRDPDERIRAYLRSRADVPVPNDLRWPSAADDRQTEPRRWWPIPLAALAAVIVAAVVIRTVLVGTPFGEAASPTPGVNSPFPAAVARMPVVSVAHAVDLLDAGELNGRAVAVAGYFFQTLTRCLPSDAYSGPFDDNCRYVAFADDQDSATLCMVNGCSPPSGIHLEPFFMTETSGPLTWTAEAALPVVLIGHAGDARQWQCAALEQDACATAFVVDRVAWADGTEIPLAPPQTTDADDYTPLAPAMEPAQLEDALPPGAEVLTAAAFRAGDISTIDPRWNLSGDDIVWLVRSIRTDDSETGPTRSVMVSLVDDATGTIRDTHDLALDPAYRPARLWTIATAQGTTCCDGSIGAFYGVRSNDGTQIHESRIGGGAFGSGDTTTFGIGVPLILQPATYSVWVWLAPSDDGAGAPSGECTTDVTLNELDDLMLEATFADDGQDCTLGPPFSPRLSF